MDDTAGCKLRATGRKDMCKVDRTDGPYAWSGANPNVYAGDMCSERGTCHMMHCAVAIYLQQETLANMSFN